MHVTGAGGQLADGREPGGQFCGAVPVRPGPQLAARAIASLVGNRLANLVANGLVGNLAAVAMAAPVIADDGQIRGRGDDTRSPPLGGHVAADERQSVAFQLGEGLFAGAFG